MDLVLRAILTSKRSLIADRRSCGRSCDQGKKHATLTVSVI